MMLRGWPRRSQLWVGMCSSLSTEITTRDECNHRSWPRTSIAITTWGKTKMKIMRKQRVVGGGCWSKARVWRSWPKTRAAITTEGDTKTKIRITQSSPGGCSWTGAGTGSSWSATITIMGEAKTNSIGVRGWQLGGRTKLSRSVVITTNGETEGGSREHEEQEETKSKKKAKRTSTIDEGWLKKKWRTGGRPTCWLERTNPYTSSLEARI